MELSREMENFRLLRPLFQMTVYNWKPIVYTAVILAMKVQLDRKLSNENLEIVEAL